MALPFVWKRFIVWFVTLFVVVFVGLVIGGYIHDMVQKNIIPSEDKAPPPPGSVQIPSLAYPVAPPSAKGPAANR